MRRGIYVLPSAKCHGVPRTRVKDSPEDDGHEEWVGSDGGVEKAVEGTKGARPAVEEDRVTFQGIAGCVDGGEEHVETYSPVGQPGEVAEALADFCAVAMSAAPAPDEEDAGEDVEGDGAAEDGVGKGREKPGGFVDVGTVSRRIDVEEVVEGAVSQSVQHFERLHALGLAVAVSRV